MTRDELIAAMKITADEKPTVVDIPGWGKVYKRSLSVAEVDEQQQQNDAEDGKPDKTRFARGAARLICDEKGKRIFDPANEADVKLIAAQPWKLLRLIVQTDQEAAAGN